MTQHGLLCPMAHMKLIRLYAREDHRENEEIYDEDLLTSAIHVREISQRWETVVGSEKSRLIFVCNLPERFFFFTKAKNYFSMKLIT